MTVTQEDGTLRRHAADRPRRPPRAARPHPVARRQHGHRASPTGSRSGSRSRASATAPRCEGQDLEMQLGFSHPVTVKAPDGHQLRGAAADADRRARHRQAAVGEVAAQIRKWRPPEPYKGKGIRYAGEHVMRKVGKRRMDGSQDQGAGPAAPPPPRAGEGDRHGRAAAPGRLPLEPRHLRPGDRRRGRPHARRRRPAWTRTSRAPSAPSRPAAVGKLVAERAKAAGIAAVVFDRGGYLYHGRVKALADAARENGLEF